MVVIHLTAASIFSLRQEFSSRQCSSRVPVNVWCHDVYLLLRYLHLGLISQLLVIYFALSYFTVLASVIRYIVGSANEMIINFLDYLPQSSCVEACWLEEYALDSLSNLRAIMIILFWQIPSIELHTRSWSRCHPTLLIGTLDMRSLDSWQGNLDGKQAKEGARLHYW